MDLDLQQHEDGLHLKVRVKPRSSKSRVVGSRAGALEVAVAAPPVDGLANLELVRVLAKALGLKKSKVAIIGGETSRDKIVLLRSERATVEAALEALEK